VVRRFSRRSDDADTQSLHSAAEAGDLDALKALIAGGADPDEFNEVGDTPLIVAALAGRTEVTKVLISAGADVNRGDEAEFRSPLMLAAGAGHVGVVKLLLESGAIANASDDYGIQPCTGR
jgi:uncharacterized protein